MAPKRGLGRGLSNLIPTDDTTEDVTTKTSKQTKTGTVTKTEIVKKVEQTLNINRIEPNKNQPRKEFNEDALQELADSIKQFGVIEPLVVVKRKGYYELIAGERRWRAARLAGLKEVPVVIKDYDDQQIVEIALIENIQREDLNPIEEAHAYERLIQEFNLTQDEVAERVSKSRTTVTNALRLLKLTEKVQQMLIDDMLSTGHVRALITIADPQLQYETAMYIFDKKLSVRETESYVKKLLNKKCMKFVEGGKERQDSVYEGLKHVTSNYVMIHDGARPFVKKDLLDRLVEGMEEHKAVLAMVPCKDTIKRVKDGKVVETLIRSELMQAQTPQAFDTVLIKNAYKEAIENNIQATDDASMLELQGKDVYVVEGDYDNIKITTKEDLK